VIRVRPATADDVPALRAVGVRTWRATYAGVLPDAVVAGGVEEFFNDWSLGAAVRAGRMLAADLDGVMSGLLEFDRVDATRTAVWKVYVAPEAQRRGIGTALLERAVAVAGTPEVGAEHPEANAAAGAFLEGLGFAVVSVEATAGGVRTVRRVRRLS
jgi:ribosomal protein S18 acetylase RimI-like enzyme